ncbi:MAG: hypothetical protein ACP5OG_04570 [Candidatus Nanoarchaeia archaeon]
MINKKFSLFLGIFALFAYVLILGIFSAEPNGATVNVTRTDRHFSSGGSESVGISAGNLSQIDIYGVSISSSWHGFMGNISGGFRLSDAAGNVFYNWTSVTANGEVYASVNESIIWTNIQCFNFSATGNYSDDSANKGNTSLYGMNLTQLEAQYNINVTDVDGVDETFLSNDHDLFYTNSLKFDSGECPTARILNQSGQGIFQEALLYSPDSRAVVFASILMDNTIGFDGRTYDFQMLVLEDGHGTDTATTDYYFYLELG